MRVENKIFLCYNKIEKSQKRKESRLEICRLKKCILFEYRHIIVMRSTKIESLSEFGSFYRKIELSEFVRNWHILGVRILSINELFCHVGNCWNLSKDVNGIDTQYQLEKCNRQKNLGQNPHKNQPKKPGQSHHSMTPTTPTALPLLFRWLCWLGTCIATLGNGMVK